MSSARSATTRSGSLAGIGYDKPVSLPLGPGLVLSRLQPSRRRFDRGRGLVHDLADLVLAHDERGRELDRVARKAQHDAGFVERMFEHLVAALAGLSRDRREIDRAGQTDAADVDHVRQ